MIKQTVVWTVIPNGVEAGELKLVCLASPRLSDDGNPDKLTLDRFDDVRHWASTTAGITFNVTWGSGETVEARRLSADPEGQLWDGLFPSGTFVRSYQFTDHSERNLRSYPARHVADALTQLYRHTAVNSPTGYPMAKDLLRDQLPGKIAMPRGDLGEPHYLTELDAQFNAGTRALPPGPADPLRDFLQAKRFHLVRGDAQQVPPRPTPEELDFHQVLALLMEHPALQRRLGLAFDLTVPIPAGMPADTTVRVVPAWQPQLAGTINNSPATAVTYGPGRFLPKASGDIADGMLDLSNDNYQVTLLDLDGGALKLRQFSDNIKRAWQVARSADTPERYALPALRSGGFLVTRTGRAAAQATRFVAARAVNDVIVAGGTPTLDAGSLLRGLRWHVYDVHSACWYSLCRRVGSYNVAGTQFAVGDAARPWEEAAVTGAATQRVDGSGSDFYLAENLVRWQGESLVAPRAGLSLGKDPSDPPVADGGDPPDGFALRAAFRPAPGSLPPLRFGRRYRLRAQAEFVGGAGLPFNPPDAVADFTGATAELTYARVEPVPAPEVVLRKQRTAGESVDHVVIRTEWDSNAQKTVASERHLLPPRTAQATAEQHGMFDAAGGLRADAYDMIKARADGVLSAAGGADPQFDTDQLAFEVENGSTAQVPWLSDPFARGAALLGLPGVTSGKVFKVAFNTNGAAWPNLRPFRLKLVEGSAAPSSQPGLVQVALGKGDVAEVELSSILDPADLPAMEIWQWMTQAGLPAATLNARQGEALAGRNWLITPKRKLTLVCAVRQPLVVPAFTALSAQRANLGATSAFVVDHVTIDRKTTGGLDLRAAWTDVVDHLDDGGWEPAKAVTRSADLGETVVEKPGPLLADNELTLARSHEFGDTNFHRVTYSAVAKSRFAEYFVERVTVTLPEKGAAGLDKRGIAPSSEEIRSVDGSVTYLRDRDYTVDYSAGSVTRVPGGDIKTPATVQIRFTPTVGHTSAPSPIAEVEVRSSARPAAPAPLYVVPTFGWQTQRPSAGQGMSGDVLSHRAGNGLRVYLDRPWWSSGSGEQLAVVLLPAGGQLTERNRPYVTQWGMDPVFTSKPTTTDLPQQAHFGRRTGSPGALPLAEIAGPQGQVLIAPHTVQPDPARRLWYCDIELKPGDQTYFPFVRLALARYQPGSMAGAELSRVVLADFAQLTPDRWVTLTYQDPAQVVVNVFGPSYTNTALSPALGGKIVVTVEQRDPAVPGELGWTPISPATTFANGAAWMNGLTRWNGLVSLPAPRGSTPMRLVIREYERFSPGALGERQVFTDIVEVL